jgi:hypothetical protein
MKALVFIALLACLTPDSCDVSSMDAKAKADQAAADQRAAGLIPKSQPVTRTCSTDHRFERTEVYPLALRADIALDTCTGQLCRTWPWAAKTTNAWSTYQDLPLCSDLPNQK